MRKIDQISFRIILIVCIGLVIWGAIFFTSLSLGLRKAIVNDEFISLEKKVKNVTGLIDYEKNDLLEYLENLSHDEEIDLKDKAKVNEMLNHWCGSHKLTAVAIFDLHSKLLFSINSNSFTKMSEKSAISEAINGQNVAKVTVKDSSVLITAVGLLPVDDGNAVILLQKTISSSDILARYATSLDCNITFFIDDLRVGTTVKDSSGNFLVGTRLNNSKIYETVYSKGERYKGRNFINNEEFLTSYQKFETDDKNEKVMIFAGISIDYIEGFVAKFYSVVIPVVLIMVISLALLLIMVINKNILNLFICYILIKSRL